MTPERAGCAGEGKVLPFRKLTGQGVLQLCVFTYPVRVYCRGVAAHWHHVTGSIINNHKEGAGRIGRLP